MILAQASLAPGAAQRCVFSARGVGEEVAPVRAAAVRGYGRPVGPAGVALGPVLVEQVHLEPVGGVAACRAVRAKDVGGAGHRDPAAGDRRGSPPAPRPPAARRPPPRPPRPRPPPPPPPPR